MDNRNVLVGWSDDQWNRIREAVREEAHKARVAANFLPPYGPLPPSTEVVPSERFDPATGEVNDVFVAPLVEIFEEVVLSGQQVNEDELSSALLAFRRASNDVAQVEDRIIFNGQHNFGVLDDGRPVRRLTLNRVGNRDIYQDRTNPNGNEYNRVMVRDGEQDRDYENVYFGSYNYNLTVPPLAGQPATPQQAGDDFHFLRLQATNPGGLGLLPGASLEILNIPLDPAQSNLMVGQFINAVTMLEGLGHGAPFFCILGSRVFQATHRPGNATTVLPSDQIEPVLGSQLLRSSAIDDFQGIVLSLAGDPIDLAVAVDASPQFLNISEKGKYRFRVVERFALRIKDPDAIVRMEFDPPPELPRLNPPRVRLRPLRPTVAPGPLAPPPPGPLAPPPPGPLAPPPEPVVPEEKQDDVREEELDE